MKTKTLLTYGAIAVGAYLAYKFLFKKNTSDANFANANGGFSLGNLFGGSSKGTSKGIGNLFGGTSSGTSSGTLTSQLGGILTPPSNPAINQFDAWVAAYVKLKKYPTYIWKPCRDLVVKTYYKNLNQNILMSNIGMQQMFEICVNQKLLNMQNQANLGSSSVRNTATM
jgi:hypothetical protein